MKKKLKRLLLSERGDSSYISSFVYILVAVVLIAFIINVFHIISTKQEISQLKECGTMPFIAVPAGAGNENAVWVYPDQVCTVEYMPNTKNSLRQAVFKGFRTDMVPEDID